MSRQKDMSVNMYKPFNAGDAKVIDIKYTEMFISIPEMPKLGTVPLEEIGEYSEVRTVYKGEEKQFTFDEFAKRLGYKD